MTSNSLTENGEHNIPSNFEDHFWIACLCYYQTPICVISNTFVGSRDPKLQWSISRTNCLYHSTRVELYSHQMLLEHDDIQSCINLCCSSRQTLTLSPLKFFKKHKAFPVASIGANESMTLIILIFLCSISVQFLGKI